MSLTQYGQRCSVQLCNHLGYWNAGIILVTWSKAVPYHLISKPYRKTYRYNIVFHRIVENIALLHCMPQPHTEAELSYKGIKPR